MIYKQTQQSIYCRDFYNYIKKLIIKQVFFVYIFYATHFRMR